MTTLISLISGQLLPNFLLLKELEKENIKIEKHLIITTTVMEKSKKSEHYKTTAQLNDDICTIVEVIEDSFKDIEDKLTSLTHKDEQYIVNITGGTKIMSMAVFNFFNKFEKTEFYYLPINKNSYKKLNRDSQIFESVNQIKYKCSLEEYFGLHGIEIMSQTTENKLPENTYEKCINFFNIFQTQQLNDNFFEELRRLRATGKKNVNIKDSTIQQQLLNINYIFEKDTNTLTKKEIKFLTGDWFELLIFYTILNQQNYKFDTKQLATGVQIKKQGAQNEFDITYIYQNALYTIECKTVLHRNFFDETAYKAATLKKETGLTTRSKLVVAQIADDLKQEDKIKPNVLNRMNALGIQLIVCDSIETLKNVRWM